MSEVLNLIPDNAVLEIVGKTEIDQHQSGPIAQIGENIAELSNLFGDVRIVNELNTDSYGSSRTIYLVGSALGLYDLGCLNDRRRFLEARGHRVIVIEDSSAIQGRDF